MSNKKLERLKTQKTYIYKCICGLFWNYKYEYIQPTLLILVRQEKHNCKNNKKRKLYE